MAIDSGSEQTQLLAAIRATLNASAIALGSKATTGTAAPITPSATAFTGGIVLTNASSTAAEIIWLCKAGPATVGGVDCYPLLAGAPLPLGWGDLHTISAIAASGAPVLAWVGTTL